MTMQSKTFEINSTVKAIPVDETGETDALYIKGIANTGLADLVGDIVTKEALEQIAEQIPRHNLHLDHGREVKDILGPLLSGTVTENGLEYEAKIISPEKEYLRHILEEGVNLGSSISGSCDYEVGSDTNIVNWDLTEISLTGIPCDQGTMATVSISKSFDNILKELKQNNNKIKEVDNMAEEGETTAISKEDVIGIVNDAINEVKDELLETVRSELEGEFVTGEQLAEAINAVKEEIKPAEEKPAEEEGKSTDEEEEEEKAGNNPDEEKPEDEEEEKALETIIEKRVNEKVENIFKNLNKNVTNKYEPKVPPAKEEKKSYTPAEIATML